MAENLSDFTASNLTCTESTNTCFDGFDCNATNGDDDDQNSQNHSQDSNFINKRSIFPMGFFPFQTVSEELLREMAVKEGELLPKHDYLNRLRSGDLDSRVRREALDWILKVVFFFLSTGVPLCFACFDPRIIAFYYLIFVCLFFFKVFSMTML